MFISIVSIFVTEWSPFGDVTVSGRSLNVSSLLESIFRDRGFILAGFIIILLLSEHVSFLENGRTTAIFLQGFSFSLPNTWSSELSKQIGLQLINNPVGLICSSSLLEDWCSRKSLFIGFNEDTNEMFVLFGVTRFEDGTFRVLSFISNSGLVCSVSESMNELVIESRSFLFGTTSSSVSLSDTNNLDNFLFIWVAQGLMLILLSSLELAYARLSTVLLLLDMLHRVLVFAASYSQSLDTNVKPRSRCVRRVSRIWHSRNLYLAANNLKVGDCGPHLPTLLPFVPMLELVGCVVNETILAFSTFAATTVHSSHRYLSTFIQPKWTACEPQYSQNSSECLWCSISTWYFRPLLHLHIFASHSDGLSEC